MQHNYLTVPLPADWEDASQVIALGPEQHGFRSNLVFSQESTEFGETAADFAERQLPKLQEALLKYQVVKEGPARYGPNSGYLREHTFSIDIDKGEIGQLQFYCVMGGRCYTFTFTHVKGSLDAAKPIAEKMFAQARLNPPVLSVTRDDF
jgi:hypothetical protein